MSSDTGIRGKTRPQIKIFCLHLQGRQQEQPQKARLANAWEEEGEWTGLVVTGGLLPRVLRGKS